MKVVHINTFDNLGGAARAAYRLHQGLQKIGQDSCMFVADKRSDDPFVIRYEPPHDPWSRIRREIRRQKIARSMESYLHTAPCTPPFFFADDRTMHGGDPWRHIPENDLIHLHWVSGFVDYQSFFAALPRGKPIVWTLHGMEPFTGGCYFDGGCGRFTKECGACPQLGSADASDLTRQVWRRKWKSLSKLVPCQMHVVTPSCWMCEEVKRSSLLGSFPCAVIPNGVDTDVLRPRSAAVAREVLGVPQDATVVLFIADGLREPRKGLHLLLQALAGLDPNGQIFLIALGPGCPSGLDGIPHRWIEPVNNDRFLSFVYSAADVFVAPSLQDNLPNTLLESLSCGTPAVGFSVGGIPDVIRPGITGLLAKPGDALDLRKAIVEILANEEKLREMRANCRKVAVEEYALEVQAKRYVNLYRERLERRMV